MTQNKTSDSRVYLVDSSIYIFRAWFALPESITDSEGNPANALYGFADFVAGFLESVNPRHIAFAFDESLTSSYRNEIYPEYKANREPTPEELKVQFKLCREFIRTIGITELSSGRFEADDLIGTLAYKWRQKGYPVTIVSGDKDLMQLIEEGDYWWDYARDKVLDPSGVENKFGVQPQQIADMLAITGDKVDNIPGVPGVGVKTAARLLNKLGNLQEILNNIDSVGKMKIRGAKRIQKLLDEHRDTMCLAKQLTFINSQMDIPEKLSITRKPVDSRQLEHVFDKFGFGKLRRERWQSLLELHAG